MKESLQLWPTLRRIAMTLGLGDREMAEYLKLSLKDYQRRKKDAIAVSISSIMGLSERLNVGYESLIRGQVDYRILMRQYSGKKSEVPEKYMKNALTKRRASLNILNYIETRYGWETRLDILRHFQMTDEMFLDPDEAINMLFSLDLCKYLYRYHRSDSVLLEMGQLSARSALGQSEFKAYFEGTNHLGEVFEVAINQVVPKLIEQNIHWTLDRLNFQSCTIIGRPNLELIGDLGKSTIDSPELALYRLGFGSAISCAVSLPPVRCERIKCLSQGDPYYQFKFHFFQGHYPLSQVKPPSSLHLLS